MKELPEKWKESISVPLFKKGHKTGCSNYKGLWRSLTTYKTLTYILLSTLIQYVQEIIVDRQRSFQRKSWINDFLFWIREIRGIKGIKRNSASALSTLKKTCDSIRREVLYIFFEFGIYMKMLRLIHMCRNATYSWTWVGQILYEMFLLGMAWNKEMIYRHCFHLCFTEHN
jgi:hypothetical protein